MFYLECRSALQSARLPEVIIKTTGSRSRLPGAGPNYSVAKAFFDVLRPGEELTFQTVFPGKHPRGRILHGFLDDLWADLADYNLRGANIYFMINRGDGKGRKVTNVTAIAGFFISVPGASKIPVTRLDELPIGKPHVIVQSSKDSLQAHWKIKPLAVTPQNRCGLAEVFRRIQIELAQRVGGDVNLTDLTRCAHVPGFLTYKNGEHQVRFKFP